LDRKLKNKERKFAQGKRDALLSSLLSSLAFLSLSLSSSSPDGRLRKKFSEK